MLKDERLDAVARQEANIAQFISFSPNGDLRYSWLKNTDNPDVIKRNQLEFAIRLLWERNNHSVNLRTFHPDKKERNPFIYGIMDLEEAVGKARSFFDDGWYVIANETISLNDGGFSGVVFGNVMQGAPNESPRCVETPGYMELPRSLGFELVKKVYGYDFHMPFTKEYRVEFSVHPFRRGYHEDFIIFWEADQYDPISLPSKTNVFWPNKYSISLGDKAFGLLIADLLGLPVPKTKVFSRLVPQFELGTSIGNNEPVWIRTAPREQTPGKFKTLRGYSDPFQLMAEDDPDGSKIAALLIQDGIKAKFSGAGIVDSNGSFCIQGCQGYGDQFMIGEVKQQELPNRVIKEVRFLNDRIEEKLGQARFEWVYDGEKAWIVQLHVGKSPSSGNVVYPGNPEEWHEFDVTKGLESLRKLVQVFQLTNEKEVGIILKGEVSIVSHMGDILRKSKIPSKIVD